MLGNFRYMHKKDFTYKPIHNERLRDRHKKAQLAINRLLTPIDLFLTQSFLHKRRHAWCLKLIWLYLLYLTISAEAII